jgi:hypothetical protein
MVEFITINPHLQEIISNIKTELDLQDHLLVTDEDEGTECPVENLYKASLEKEKALYTYLGAEVFEQYLTNDIEFYKESIKDTKPN